ncbi:MAG: PAC2 family protein [Ilumatobacteraceae bacterium]
MDYVRWRTRPSLRSPIMVCAFTGWNDAGDAASTALAHLTRSWQAQPLAEIDPEEFTDFATVRPMVKLTPERQRTIEWPSVDLWHASTPGGDVVLLLGPEPALRWRLFTEQVVGIARELHVSMVLSLGALLADVPHSRPTQIIGTATDQSMLDRFELQRSRYEGPTGIVGVVHDACARADLPSASLWAAVPAYASQVPSPKAALALVERACEMIGTPPPVGSLRADADRYDERVTAFVADDDDLIGYVDRLESMSDDELYDDEDEDDAVGGELVDDAEAAAAAAEAIAALDSEELMLEVEKFLRDQDGPER